MPSRLLVAILPVSLKKLKLIWFYIVKPRLMPDLPKPIPLTGFSESCVKCTLQGPTGPDDSPCCESKSKWTRSITKEGFCTFTAAINTVSRKGKAREDRERQVSIGPGTGIKMSDCCLWKGGSGYHGFGANMTPVFDHVDLAKTGASWKCVAFARKTNNNRLFACTCTYQRMNVKQKVNSSSFRKK